MMKKEILTSPSSSRQWAGFKNPRIVRVSRAFGGKDRHSKVCTVRGLRDRRIRLSVPTAIQLYDLQDRLGLSQPSKVVDWLLDATKHDIDKLPPLQLPPGSFSRSHQPPHIFQDSANTEASLSHYFNANPSYMKDGAIQGFLSSKEGLKIGDNFDASLREKSKGTDTETASGKGKWIASNEQENQEGIGIGGYVPQVSAQNFFPFGNQSYLPGMTNNPMTFNWEPSNLSLAQFGNNSFSADSQNNLPVSFPSSMPCPSGSQLYFYPTATALPSIIPPYMTTSIDTDPRHVQQLNHFHLLSSNSQHALPNQLVPTLQLISSPMKSFSLNDDPQGFHSHEDDNSQPHKGGSSS